MSISDMLFEEVNGYSRHDKRFVNGYNQALEDFSIKLKHLIPKDGIYTGQVILECVNEVIEKLEKYNSKEQI